MRIIHAIRRVRFDEGGVVRAALDMCQLLASMGHEVELLVFEDRDAEEGWRRGDPGLPRVVVLPPPNALGRMSEVGLAVARQRIADADVLHLHGLWRMSTAQLAQIARDTDVPYVVSLHGMLDQWSMKQARMKKRIYLSTYGRILLTEATAIHCTAEAEATQARAWLPNPCQPLTVIPLAFDDRVYRHLPGPEMAREQFRLDPLRPTVLFLSRLHPKKRPEAVIEAVRQLQHQGHRCELLLAGSGESAYVAHLRALVMASELNPAPRLLGLVDGDLKRSLYQAADVLALPTSQENFGLVIVEALACGTPAVTTRGVDIWPELEHSGAVVLAEPTGDAFSAEIGALLAEPALRRSMGEKGRRWVLDYLDPQRVGLAYLDMYTRASKTIAMAPT